MNDYENFEVIGMENGGVDVVCLDCEEWAGGGGCSCCKDQEVRISDLIRAADAHTCPPEVERGNE
ncbi:hypothetical protein [Streptomyces sp. NPDC014733]|uniref:hypothetical protein n=1 Tax=Streptomyces sp. NPDC014733 TaxID=3364885 RepID=UPI0036F5B590